MPKEQLPEWLKNRKARERVSSDELILEVPDITDEQVLTDMNQNISQMLNRC